MRAPVCAVALLSAAATGEQPAVVVAPGYGLDSEEQDGEQGGAAVAAATCTPVLSRRQQEHRRTPLPVSAP